MSEIDSLEYNTARPKMLIPEYGRNVQKMVDHAVSLEDREERNKVAQAIIKVMGELKPELRDVEEYKPKLWTHLFIMSNFELEVDSPYPLPNREELKEKPKRVAYPQTRIKIGHYGKNVELLIAKAIEMEDPDEREALVKTIACMMKQFYLTFNSTSIEDDMIIDHLAKLSDGKIQLTDVSYLPSTGSILKANGTNKNSSNNNKKSNNKNRNNSNNKNRNKNNRKRY
ncbi:MAG: DUF4290 domain-containing protein [Crocinitomix sp.]|nr:DUF4290 domain-containing protein [Crocinitomix sp.]